MLSLFSADSLNCGPGERAKQGQFGLRPFCISIQLASLDLGLVQYQYELKLFKWTIQSIDYKWRKYRLETYKFGLVQYQYELKLFKWTIQSIDYKWRKYRLETYKFLLCTVLATVLYHMALKLPWGIYLLERVGVLLLSLTNERLISGQFFT